MKIIVTAQQLTNNADSVLVNTMTVADLAVRSVEKIRTLLDPQAPVFLLGDTPSLELVRDSVPENWQMFCCDRADEPSLQENTSVNGATSEKPAAEHQNHSPQSLLLGRMSQLVKTGDDRAEPFVVTSLDHPLVSAELAQKAVSLHNRWWCDYTFGEGYPAGLCPQVIRAEAIDPVLALAAGKAIPWSSNWLFDVISTDVNAFDIETVVPTEDYSTLRMDMTVRSANDLERIRRLVSVVGTTPGTDRLLEEIRTNGRVQRVLPTYAFVQITTRTAQIPEYRKFTDAADASNVGFESERSKPAGFDADSVVAAQLGSVQSDGPVPQSTAPDTTGRLHMTREQFAALADDLADFAPGIVLAIGYLGEPSLHPEIDRILETIRDHPNLHAHVETSGIGWGENPAERIKRVMSDRITFIVELDTNNADTYQAIRGEGFEEAQRFAHTMIDAFPKNTYVQAIRIEETESELPDFYRSWKEKTENVIIQKYNNFAGRLPQRKVADLSPLERFPCRHLQRELAISVDGNVIRCFQDILREHGRGNVFRDPLGDLWESGQEDYERHLRQNYPHMCRNCDEYYTFNA